MKNHTHSISSPLHRINPKQDASGLPLSTEGKEASAYADESNYHLPQVWAQFLDNPSYHWSWYGHFTFRDYPHPETAGKAWDKFIHCLNREAYGSRYWKDKSKGVTWARGTEDQKRGAVHFHALIGNLPERVRRMDYVDMWYDMAGIGRIYAYEAGRGAEFYMSKSTYAWKKGEIDLSETMKYHGAQPVLPTMLR